MTRLALKVGDRVTWGGAAQPHINEKTGDVFEVVPAGELPLSDFDRQTTIPRNHESYVVKVKRSLYWPRVSNLRVAVEP